MHTVIVGAGVAGITLAQRLLENDDNCRITLIDAGKLIDQKDYRKWIDFVGSGFKNVPYDNCQEKKGNNQQLGVDPLRLSGSRYFAIGGSTNAWGGWCLRYKPEDFYLNANTGYGLDWLYDYSKLEPFYERAEKTLWVAGKNKPNKEIPYTLKDGVIIETLKRKGLSFENLPMARKESCMTIGTCRYCPIGMRYQPYDQLQEILSSNENRINVIDNSVVRGLHFDNRKCKSLTYYSVLDDADKTIEFDRAVIASGAIESPKLLLQSKEAIEKAGTEKIFLHVGRHITAHPLIRVVGEKPNNESNMEQPVDFPTLASRAYDTEEMQDIGKLFFVRDGRKNATKIEEELISGKSISYVKNKMKEVMPFELRGFVEIFSNDENFIRLDSKSYGDFKIPRTKVNFHKSKITNQAIERAQIILSEILKDTGCNNTRPETYSTIRADHATSTCRMSKSDEDGVVDENLLVHSLDNLYICSNAVLPNGAAVNPTLTLVAITEKLADHLINQ